MKDVKALKKYGQNFLKNEEILKNISSLADVTKDDLIIEIGPGMGALTKYLESKPSFLLCYEIDERMKPFLEKYESDNIKIIYDDFMKRDIVNDITFKQFQDIYVVANIPYYITTPILMKLINLQVLFKRIVLLVQKEFAYRLTANYGHKEYNALSLFVDYYYDVSLKWLVSRECFVPSPKVDSAVILLEKKQEEKIIGENEYFVFIKDAFKNKRKTLKNNLVNYNWQLIFSILNKLGYEENVRAEEISKENFKNLWIEYYLKKV